MTREYGSTRYDGGSAPATPGFNAVAPEWLAFYGAAVAAPVIPAAESTLGSHPCVALSSAQVSPEWITLNLAVDTFPSNGDYPLNLLSQLRGSVQDPPSPPFPSMFNFSANHLFLLTRTEYPKYAVFLLQDHDTQRVYRLYDFTKAQLIQPNVAYCIAGKVNSADRLYLVIDSLRPDTKHAARSTVPALADGAGGTPID